MTTLQQSKETNDIMISGGDIQLASGLDAYGVVISDEVRTCLGELQLDSNIGIPYFDTIFSSINNVAIWKMYVARAIRRFEFVNNIQSMDVNIDSDQHTLSFTIVIETDKGLMTVVG